MAKFVKIPEAEDDRSIAEVGSDTLATYGLETGLIGAGLLALGGVLILVGLIQVIRVIRTRIVERLAEGEIVSVEPAPSSGFFPVIRYRDAAGNMRRFVSDLVVPGESIGQKVRLRIDGRRPKIVARPPSAFAEMLAMLLPLAIGSASAVTGLTGRLAGLVPLPFF
ncbi:MAG: DUF3592 domain-containing protein [Pseudomonadota bacterium]